MIETMVLLLVTLLFGVWFALLYKGFDRKLVARMQSRYGPPVTQPIKDIRKLMVKQTIVPKHAVPWLFNGAPFLALVSSVLLLVFIPFFSPAVFQGDLIFIWYVMLLPSLALVIGGFASGSPYATIGAQREMVLMASYEMPLAISIVSIAYVLNSFSLDYIFLNPVWGSVGLLGIIGFAILFLVMLTVIAPELSKTPFDSPEAETELAGGLLAEYSGRNLGFFYISDTIKSFALCSLVIAMFFPYGISQALGTHLIVDALFFLVKVFVLMFASVFFVRAAFARLRIEQAGKFFLAYMLAFSTLGLLLVVLDGYFPIEVVL